MPIDLPLTAPVRRPRPMPNGGSIVAVGSHTSSKQSLRNRRLPTLVSPSNASVCHIMAGACLVAKRAHADYARGVFNHENGSGLAVNRGGSYSLQSLGRP